jgi:hypothetical protein
MAAVGEDVNQMITGGDQFPSRDASGNRDFNHGENRILRIYETKVRLIQNAITKALKELGIGEAARKILGAELQAAQEKYEKDQHTDEKELADFNNKIEMAEMEVAPMSLSVEEDAPKNKDKKRKPKGLLSFLLVAFIAEFVAFLATFNLQQENLSTDAIWWRMAYIGVIYVYTIILYLKYVKTRVLAVKGLLVGCILLGFFCLLHAVAVTFLNLDTVTTTNAGYDLTQIDPAVTETNTSILTNLITKPGLAEFLVATLLVFIGEIVTIDGKKKEETETADESVNMLSEDTIAIDIDNIDKHNAARRLAILKERRAKLLERCNKRTTLFNELVDNINAQLEANEKKMEQAQTELDKHQQEMEALLDKAVSDLAKYRKLLMNELAFKLAVDMSSFKYEPATKADVKVYYKL